MEAYKCMRCKKEVSSEQMFVRCEVYSREYYSAGDMINRCGGRGWQQLSNDESERVKKELDYRKGLSAAAPYILVGIVALLLAIGIFCALPILALTLGFPVLPPL
jgi:hypothetical protein